MKTLPQTLKYQNLQLLLRIQRSLDCSRAEAKAIYGDLLHWMWLCGRYRQKSKADPAFLRAVPDIRMLDHFKAIDYAWHEFILMTKAYDAFCHEYLGRFVHHTPGLINNRLKRKNGGRIAGKRYLQSYLTFIYDELGEACFNRWVNVLPTVKVPE